MDRIINVKVGGNHLSKDSKNAGTRGEANVAILRITFDEGWDSFNKKITFWNARGLNPVVIDLLPHLAESSLVYLVPIPAEPMEIAGELTFVIEGTVNEKVQRSLEDKLEVKDAAIATNAGQPVPPTEDELTQLAGEIEQIKGDILVVRDAKDEAEEFAEKAATNYQLASEAAEEAEKSATMAEQSATKAETAVGKTSYIGENGNWYAWDSTTDAFYDTGVKAQAGSTVYCGDNPPDDADVWIDPDDDGVVNEYIKKLEIVNEYIYKIDEVNEHIEELSSEAKAYTDGQIAEERANTEGMVNFMKNDAVGEALHFAEEYDKQVLSSAKSYTDEAEEAAKLYADEKAALALKDAKAYIDSEIQKVIAYSDQKDTETLSIRSFVNILGGAENWTEEEVTDTSGNIIGSRYGQVVNVNNAIITPNSMVNLQLTSEQVIIFQNKALAFYAENDEGVVTVYCIGQIPENDYTIQATVTEVVIDD